MHELTAARARLERMLADVQDVEEPDVSELIASSDARDRALAHKALYLTLLRKAVDQLFGAALAENFGDQAVTNNLRQLALAAQNEVVGIEFLKRDAIALAAQGSVEPALQAFSALAARAFTAGQKPDARSRHAMRYLTDADIDLQTERLARQFARIDQQPTNKRRYALVVSAIHPESATPRVALSIAAGLRARGADMRIVSAELFPSSGALFEHTKATYPTFLANATTFTSRIQSLIDYFVREPADVVFYIPYPTDVSLKVVGCSGLARAQVAMFIAQEQLCGRYDAVLKGVSPDEIARAVRPDVAVFVGSGCEKGEDVAHATPVSLEQFGVPAGALTIGTYGRLEKVAEPRFINAIATILLNEPQAVYVIAGTGATRDPETYIRRAFEEHGLTSRVFFLGAREDDLPGILRATDVYCDTFPWCGGQSVLESMFAGIPVAGMKIVADLDLDPSASGPLVACAEIFLGPDVRIAPALDIEAYVEIALSYLRSPAERGSAGEILRKRARQEYGWEPFIDRVDDELRRVIRERAADDIFQAGFAAIVNVDSMDLLMPMIEGMIADSGTPHVDGLVLVANGLADTDLQKLRSFSGAVRTIEAPAKVSALEALRLGVAGERSPYLALFTAPCVLKVGWAARSGEVISRNGQAVVGNATIVRNTPEALGAAFESLTTSKFAATL